MISMAGCIGCKKQKECYGVKLKRLTLTRFTDGNRFYNLDYITRKCSKRKP